MTETEQLLAIEALDALPAHIAILDADGVVVLLNRAWKSFARQAGSGGAASHTGVHYRAICCDPAAVGEAAEDLERAISEALRGGRENVPIDYRCRVMGEERWFRMSASRFGLQPYVVVTREDITRQKQHERVLEQSEGILRSVLEALPVGVWILDASGRILHGNAAGMAIWGGARFVGPEHFGEYKGWWLDTGQSIAADEWAAARAITTGETSIDEEIEIEAFDGTRKVISNSAVPLFDGEHRITGAIIVNQDITTRKRAEAEREALIAEHDRLRQAAQDAERMKDDFIAMLSHELRTPLQSVLGWSTILKRVLPDVPASRRGAAAIERNALVLSQLLDDTLDLSRITRGKLTLTPSAVDLTAVVADVVESMRPGFVEKNVTLVDRLGAPVVLFGDSTRLQQIVWNLLANALKFTPPGGRVNVQMDRTADSVDISVSDTGVGIAPEFLPFVFERFRQSDGAERVTRAGLGLGLAIVKELVELHRGTISVESAGPGQGATFRLRLPVVPTAESEISGS